MAYDLLLGWQPSRAAKQYLRILHLAARESEASVERAVILGRSGRNGTVATERVRAVVVRRTFSSLAIRNYRLYVLGQIVSRRIAPGWIFFHGLQNDGVQIPGQLPFCLLR